MTGQPREGSLHEISTTTIAPNGHPSSVEHSLWQFHDGTWYVRRYFGVRKDRDSGLDMVYASDLRMPIPLRLFEAFAKRIREQQQRRRTDRQWT